MIGGKRLKQGWGKEGSSTRRNKSIFNNAYSEALSVALIYSVFGILWIVLSDRVLSFFVGNNAAYMKFQTIKGWFYIFITAILVYFLIKSRLRRIQEQLHKTEQAYGQLRVVHEEMVCLESELVYQKNLNENIIMEAPVIIMTWNDEGLVTGINPFGLKRLGYTQEDIRAGFSIDRLYRKDDLESSQWAYDAIIKEKQLISFEGPIQTRDGSLVEVLWSSKLLATDSKDKGTFVSIGTDIGERKRYEEKVRYLAFYDSLTGLPNRAKFELEINKRLEPEHGRFMIAYIDIDNFKNINDSLGHHVGDLFLKYLSDCIKDIIKEPDYISRLGGDEFAILYQGETPDTIQPRLEAIINSISKIWKIENSQFYITMSIGVVSYPEHGDSASTLLKNADIALYEAKREGKNRYVLYQDEISESNSGHIKIINNLQSAIEQEQFTLVYQPQFKLETGEIIGMEALVRWLHPEEGMIPPSEFIPLAEQTGQIYSLEKLIFRKALAQKALWEAQGFTDRILSINLSTKTLTSRINFNELEKMLTGAQVNYPALVIEITETAGISEVDMVIDHLKRLKKLGIKIALDDFGTGYSSLNYLKKFPIDIIKLDRSFINAISEEKLDALLIKNIMALAHDLSFEVIAEGIETMEQLNHLRGISCEAGQGFLLSKPVPEEELRNLLKENYIFQG